MGAMSAKEKTGWYVGALLIVLYAIVPVVYIVSMSLKSEAALSEKTFFPTNATWANYQGIFAGDGADLFLPALRNSIITCLVATFIAVVLAMFAAYAIARLDFPGKRVVLTSALAVAVFPVITMVTPLFNLWRQIGLYDTIPGLIIPYLALTLPISIWTMSAFFRGIPWDMEQAAQVDGATSWQAFRKVIVPLAAPGVFTTAIIAFFIAWNDFVFGISLTSTSDAQPVPAALSSFTGSSYFVQPTGAISAAAVIVTIPVVVLALVFQRRIVAGLTNGAVKG
ncbi:carbohydrate ABC transporter membrane protein 2 (CUT1 family) [Kineococcus rhizosphaerae]|uniref:Carbohydrate ABC transporter membrane protein 2 (CUT1 family) n=2 Tax=Kineococcus rhizosphaerae TaxID=559628 RepID=A0A2T0R498_9ACTN|nr:carbohydrate ABC transporter permease [Kineococcus rhizosphaerae]PRY15196.1 carbohydrate ABC transporter membrane protein 2 (CUT1 family) [Kineococcus rhizosphaerae]